jgi:hypothetical protein
MQNAMLQERPPKDQFKGRAALLEVAQEGTTVPDVFASGV